jgi:hypothetical protein
MQQLPLLITEILDYYRYTLPQRERMKRLNEEYRERVYVDNIYLWWDDNIILAVFYNDPLTRIRKMENFVTGHCYKDYLPKYYNYSSGLNHPQGYKNKNFGQSN